MALPTCSLVENQCTIAPPALPDTTCAPAVEDGEITAIYISDVPLSAASDLASPTQAGGAGNVVKLKCTGSLNEAEGGEQVVEGGVTVFTAKKVRSISAQVYDQSDTTYNAMRTLECNKPVYVWYEVGSHVYGGEENFIDGISTVIRSNQVSDGVDSFLRWEVSFSWRAQFAPTRVVTPTAS